MPTLPMTPVMLSTTLTRTRLDGIQTDVTINFGTPTPNPNATDPNDPDFYCPIQLINMQDDTIYPIFGEDTADATINALCFAGGLLGISPYKNDFGELNASNRYGFPVRLPLHPTTAVPDCL